MHVSRQVSRYHIATVVASLALVAAACTGDAVTKPSTDEAERAVSLFTSLADSAARAGGDSTITGAYAGLAGAISMGGRVTPIVITVDGTPVTFLATAQQVEVLPGPGITTLDARLPLRSFIAWQQSDPRRILQVTSLSDTDPIRAYLFPVLVPFDGPSASLVYYDGSGGAFFGTSGTQSLRVTPSATDCTATGNRPPTIAIYPTPRCTLADFSVSMSATAQPSTFLARDNKGTGTHTFSMSSQNVPGSRIQLTATVPPLPPVPVPTGAALPSALTAAVDSLVTLTFTVKNPSAVAQKVEFLTSQQFDVTINDMSGAKLWKWSDDKGFFQALTSREIAANGTVTYTATWKPTRAGNITATAVLTSKSHSSSARVAVVIP